MDLIEEIKKIKEQLSKLEKICSRHRAVDNCRYKGWRAICLWW